MVQNKNMKNFKIFIDIWHLPLTHRIRIASLNVNIIIIYLNSF